MDRFSSTDPGCQKPRDVTKRDSVGAGTNHTESCLFSMIIMDINTDGVNVLLISLIPDGDRCFLG